MMYSDPSHELLHRIANAVERIADALEKKPEVKEKTITREITGSLEMEPPAFRTWWKLYPRKVSKQAALKKWCRKVTTPKLEKLLIYDMQQRAKAWKHTDIQFIPHPSKFLNNEGWEDPIDQAIPKQSKPEPKTESEWLALAHEKGINTVGLTLNQLKDRIRTS